MNAILLAEDEPVSRRFLGEAIQSLGYACEAVPDGAQALAAARARRFALLVLDMNLPGLPGPQVLRRLRSDPDAASSATPAIALTADHAADTRRNLLDAGFTAVGTKPIDLPALQRLLREPRDTLAGSGPGLAPAAADWDEASASRATGGRAEVVAALRALMRLELPAQRASVAQAVQQADHAAARAELHRLRAACGFCGAANLARAVDALQHALDRGTAEAALPAFLAAVDRLLVD